MSALAHMHTLACNLHLLHTAVHIHADVCMQIALVCMHATLNIFVRLCCLFLYTITEEQL